VGHPLPVASFSRGSDTTSVDIGKTQREARIPATPVLGMVPGHVAHVFHGRAEAGGTNHRAIGARQAAPGDLVPVRVLKVVVEELFDSCGINASHLLAGGGLQRRLHFPKIFLSQIEGAAARIQSDYEGRIAAHPGPAFYEGPLKLLARKPEAPPAVAIPAPKSDDGASPPVADKGGS